MNSIYGNELIRFIKEEDLKYLEDKTVLVTGATGLIGSYIIDVLMYSNKLKNTNIRVIAQFRNLEHAKKRFFEYVDNDKFHFLSQDVTLPMQIEMEVDYIIHAASNANPKTIVEDPIGTIKANVNGTINLLEYARLHNTKRTVFLSSSEVYGEPTINNSIFSENNFGNVNQLSPRSSYSESKRMAENICVNYSEQFGCDVVIARIGFAYGSTFSESDNRVIPQFVRNAIIGKDIILKSDGKITRSYIYIYDVVSAIFKVLNKGKNAEAYNVANSSSNVSILQIATSISNISGVRIKFDFKQDEKKGVSPYTSAILDCSKLESLGWKAKYNFEVGINIVINIMRNNEEIEC
jgi:UDP-glucuronate decarboxylase